MIRPAAPTRETLRRSIADQLLESPTSSSPGTARWRCMTNTSSCTPS